MTVTTIIRFSRIPLAISSLLLVAALVFAPGGRGNGTSDNGTSPASEKYQTITLEIIKKLDSKHFVDLPLDDSLSDRLLTDYLERLDPGKAFFYREDVQAFEQYRTRLDDQLKRGDNSAGFIIYSKFRQRVEQRLKTVIASLEDKNRRFDFTLDETVMIDPESLDWLENEAAADDFWRKRIKSFLLSQKLAGKSIEESREQLIKRYGNQLSRIVKNTDDHVYDLYINAFTGLYDPHTNYLAPRTAENFNINMSLSLEGIGAVLQIEDENTKVVRLVTGGPADRQGDLQATDIITGVGQGESGEITDVVGWRLDEVVALIRGPKDSVVRLQVDPADPSTVGSKIIRIKRDKVKLEDQAAQKAVFTVKADDGYTGGQVYKVGVIKIPAFYMDFQAWRERDPNYRSTTRDVFRMLKELEQEGVDGVVIDLRNNGGGSLQEATRLTDLFIDKGPVVQIGKGNRNSTTRSRYSAHYRGPLVVMINRLSASASEIFAGAIQDYQRGLIVGSQSFGKGTVQSLTPLDSTGDLKITESKFYRVSGKSTQHRGVIPDILFPELLDTDAIGESSYDTALAWSMTNPVTYSRYLPVDTIVPALRQRHNERTAVDPDFIFLNSQKSLLERFGNRKEISLNEASRKKEKTELEAATLGLENNRRVAKGLSVFKDYEALKNFSDERVKKQRAAAGTTVIDFENDPMLRAAGYILRDFTDLLPKNVPKRVAGSHH